MRDLTRYHDVVAAILADEAEIADRLGDNWPRFRDILARSLRLLAESPEETLDEAFQDFLSLGLDSAAEAVFLRHIEAHLGPEWLADQGGTQESLPGDHEEPELDIDLEPDFSLPGASPSGDDRLDAHGFQRRMRGAAEWLEGGFAMSNGGSDSSADEETPPVTTRGDGPSDAKPRRLNVAFAQPAVEPIPDHALALDEQFFVPLGADQPLYQNQMPYKLLVNVGTTFWGPGEDGEFFPDDAVAAAFRNRRALNLDVVVHYYDPEANAQNGVLELPRSGDSNLLAFDIAFAQTGRHAVSIDVLYHGHLLQSRRLEVEVVPHAGIPLAPSQQPAQDSYLTFTRTSQRVEELLEIAGRPQRATIITERDPVSGAVNLRLYSLEDEDIAYKQTTLDSVNLTAALEALRRRLQTITEAYRDIGGDEEMLLEHLGPLAYQGARLYRALLPGGLDATVRQAMANERVLQIAPLSTQLGFPWEAVYDRELESEDWTLCDSFREHEPDACPHADDSLVVCPYGFWGYRYIIEQLPCHVDRQAVPALALLAMTINNERPLDFAAFMDTTLHFQEEHWDELQSSFGQRGVRFTSFLDRRAARTFLKEQGGATDLVYFYAHGGADDDQERFVTIGDQKRIRQSDFNAWRFEWHRRRPLVVINTCDSANYTPQDFENLIRLFWQRGASGVISTQVQVRERFAQPFIIGFLEAFLSQRSAGEALYEIRRKMLLDHLDPRGLIYSLFAAAELKLGNALDSGQGVRRTGIRGRG